MSLRRPSFSAILGLILLLWSFSGCDIIDNKDPDSVSSGTLSGFGSGGTGGGPAANITLTAASENLYIGASTTLTVMVTDSAGKRTDASVTLNSSLGGTFNGNGVLNGNTMGGILTVDYKAPSVAGEDHVTATITGTSLKATLVIKISSTSEE